MVNKKENSIAEKITKILTIFFTLVFVIILLLIKHNKPEFKLAWLISIIVVLIVIVIGVFIYFSIKDRIKTDKNEDIILPPAITLEQAREIAKKATQNTEYGDYSDDGLGEEIMHIGESKKTWIYIRKSQGEYENQIYYVFLNMHFPDKKSIILRALNQEEKAMYANMISFEKDYSPHIKETYTKSPFTGIEQKTREIIKEEQKKDEKKKEEETELK